MVVYPRKLWVATGWSKAVTNRFTYHDKKALEDVSNTADACTYEVIDSRTKEYGYLIVFYDMDTYRDAGCKLVEDIAHEATHAMASTCKELHIVMDEANDEPMAYLTGWIANRCWHTLQKEIK